MLRLRLIRLPVLINNQMELRMLHAQIVQPHMRRDSAAADMREEVEYLHPQQNLIHRKIRSLPRPLKPMNHQPVSLNRKMPEIEADLPQLHSSASCVLQNLNHLFANSSVEVVRPRIPGERSK